MKKAIMLTADKFEDMEVMYPLFRLQEAEWQVDVAAPKIEEIHGEFGYGQLMPDITIEKVDPDNYDLLVIPGGSPGGANQVDVFTKNIKPTFFQFRMLESLQQLSRCYDALSC